MPKETTIDLQGIVAFDDDPWLADAGVDMITLSGVKKMLAEAPSGPLRIRLTSPGGIGVAGNAIASALYERRDDITMEVLGVAASAAAAIALSGARLEMTKGSFLMIHEGFSFVLGGAEDMEKEARALHQLNDSMAELYADASGQKVEQIKAWMADETWFSAQSAVDAGFADAATPGTGKQAATKAGQKAMAAFLAASDRWGAYRHLPAALDASAEGVHDTAHGETTREAEVPDEVTTTDGTGDQLGAADITAAVTAAMQPFATAMESFTEAMTALQKPAEEEKPPEEPPKADGAHLELVHMCGQRGISIAAGASSRDLLEALVGNPARCEGKSDDYLRALIDSDNERRATADLPDGTVPASTGPHRDAYTTAAEKLYAEADKQAEAHDKYLETDWQRFGHADPAFGQTVMGQQPENGQGAN